MILHFRYTFQIVHHSTTNAPQSLARHISHPQLLRDLYYPFHHELQHKRSVRPDCGISAPPAIHNISTCCATTDTWKIRANCTQYCEASDAGDFNACVNKDRNFLIDSGSSNFSDIPIYASLCQNASDSEDEDGRGKRLTVIAGLGVLIC